MEFGVLDFALFVVAVVVESLSARLLLVVVLVSLAGVLVAVEVVFLLLSEAALELVTPLFATE